MRGKSLEDRKMCIDNGNMIQANLVEEKEEKRKNKKIVGRMGRVIADAEVDASDDFFSNKQV